MSVYQIQNTPAETQYHGCGKAWAAIKDGQPVAIKYMGDFQFNPEFLPGWVNAVLKEYCTIADPSTHIEYIDSFRLGKIKKAAISAGHPATGPRGGYIKASSIAREARRIIRDAEREQFSDYQTSCRLELESLGSVISGMCSCYEFVVAH